jgi:hypothetical protein
MVHPLRNYDILAVFLDVDHQSTSNQDGARLDSYLLDLFSKVSVPHTKRFDGKNLVSVLLMGKSPHVKGRAGCG